MAINLKDIPEAVQAYLNTKVTVNITTVGLGTSINPGESFSVNVRATNADAANGGVALMNVKYRVTVADAAIAKLTVPASGSATDLAGQPLTAGAKVAALIFTPTGSAASLGVGDSDTVAFGGTAGNSSVGGTTQLQARIIADVDLDKLFPKGEDTPTASKTLTVEG